MGTGVNGSAESAAFSAPLDHVPELHAGDLARVMAILEQGLASPRHAEFVKRLEGSCGRLS